MQIQTRTCTYIYIFTYTNTCKERERERERLKPYRCQDCWDRERDTFAYIRTNACTSREREKERKIDIDAIPGVKVVDFKREKHLYVCTLTHVHTTLTHTD